MIVDAITWLLFQKGYKSVDWYWYAKTTPCPCKTADERICRTKTTVLPCIKGIKLQYVYQSKGALK
jgi:hypothetical protein